MVRIDYGCAERKAEAAWNGDRGHHQLKSGAASCRFAAHGKGIFPGIPHEPGELDQRASGWNGRPRPNQGSARPQL